MYPTTQQGYSSGLASQTPQQPAPIGIASRIQELQSAVAEVVANAYQIKASLGIASPETEGKNPVQAGTLAEVISEQRSKLNRANSDFQDILGHLNS